MAKVLEKPRQFIRTRGFTGPDRRRQNIQQAGPERRIVEDALVEQLAA